MAWQKNSELIKQSEKAKWKGYNFPWYCSFTAVVGRFQLWSWPRLLTLCTFPVHVQQVTFHWLVSLWRWQQSTQPNSSQMFLVPQRYHHFWEASTHALKNKWSCMFSSLWPSMHWLTDVRQLFRDPLWPLPLPGFLLSPAKGQQFNCRPRGTCFDCSE